jgi:Uncharacterized ACR, COG1399.
MLQLQKFRNEGFEFDETLDFSYLKKREKEIRSISPVRVRGTADIQSDRVTFHLHITGLMVLPSSRTLKDVSLPFDIRSTEVFAYEAEMDPDEEDEVNPIQGEKIDLTPIIEDLILVQIPIRIVGEDDDAIPEGQLSGKDWQFIENPDLEKEEKVAPRLERLADLFRNVDHDGAH